MRRRILLLAVLLLVSCVSDSYAERRISEETLLFRKVRDAVVTISGDEGSGSGFLVDSAGIVLTNDHVVGVSARIRVKLNDSTRVNAKLLSSDPKRDVAAIWISPSRVPGLPVLPLAAPGDTMVFEGEKVIAIGSPLSQERIMTAGIVSKVESRAIISDVNINHGNSGGPLLNMNGEVIAINTFGDFPPDGGPGVSGSVLITEAQSVLEEARRRVREEAPPSDSLLPTPSRIPFPVDELKVVAAIPKLETKPYDVSRSIDTGKFQVMVVTPTFHAWRSHQYERRKAEYVRKRERKGQAAKEEKYDPLRQMREWMQYTGESYTPVVTIEMTPEYGEAGGSVLGNILGGMAAGLAGTYYRGSHRYEFKADFKDVTVLRNGVEIPDVQRGKIFIPLEFAKSTWNADYWGEDFARAGVFQCNPEWFAPDSSGYPKIVVGIFSVDRPTRPYAFELPERTIQRVWADFAAHRIAVGVPKGTSEVAGRTARADSASGAVASKSTPEIEPAPVMVTLTDGTSLPAFWVKPSSMGTVKVKGSDGRETYLDASRIESITDANGVDWTERVLTERKQVPPK